MLSAEGCPSRRGIYPVLYVDKHRFAAVAVAGAGDRRKFGYAVTYNLCGAGLIIALLVYFACRGMVKDIGSEPDHRPLSLRNLALVLAGTVVMIFSAPG